MPLVGDALAPWIDVPSDCGAFVAALLMAPAGTHVVDASECLTGNQWLAQSACGVGVKAHFQKVSAEEFRRDDPTGLMHE